MLLLSTDARCREQHEAVRNAVGVYYFTHHIIDVQGPDALALLEKLYVSNISKLAPTRGRYTMMLNEDGIPQDDCVVTCLAENHYWISTLHAPRTEKELARHKGDLDVSFERFTKKHDMYAIQGPRAMEMAKAVLAEDPAGLKRFQIMENHLGDIRVGVAKGSYTGEAGVEVYCDIADSEKVKDVLFSRVADFGGMVIDEFDVIAYTLATEAGLPLVTDIDEATPFETGMDWLIDWNKPEFIGKEAVLAMRDQPQKQILVGITVDESTTKVHGGPYGGVVSKNGKRIGRVTKFTYGFTIGKWVGFALIDAGSAAEDEHVTIDWDVDAVITPRKQI